MKCVHFYETDFMYLVLSSSKKTELNNSALELKKGFEIFWKK